MPPVSIIALLLLIIGGLNWGLVGLFNFDLVAAIFGGDVGTKSVLARIVYTVVGASALLCTTLVPYLSEQAKAKATS
jgi:uncharacterized protein